MTRRSASLKAWAAASGVGYTKARAWVADPGDPLPHLRIARRIHVDLAGAERWLSRHDERERIDLSSVVDEIAAELEEGDRRRREVAE